MAPAQSCKTVCASVCKKDLRRASGLQGCVRCQTQKHSRDPVLVTKMCEHVTFRGEESADGFDLRSFSGKKQLNRRFQKVERDIGEHHRATWSWKEEDGWWSLWLTLQMEKGGLRSWRVDSLRAEPRQGKGISARVSLQQGAPC